MTKHITVVAVILAAFTHSIAPSSADDHSVDLVQQVNRMQFWLGAGPKAEGWRRYLVMHRLQSNATRGWNADPVVLSQILNVFESGTPGLEHSVIEGVRSSLRSHLANLEEQQISDIPAAIEQAADKYRPITKDEMVGQRDRLSRELKMLQSFYQRSMLGEDFQAAVEELDLTNLIVLVDSLSFSQLPQAADPSEEQKSEIEKITRERADVLKKLQAAAQKFVDATYQRDDSYFPISKRQIEKLSIMYGFYDSPRGEAIYKQLIALLKTQYAAINDYTKRAEHGALGLTLGRLDCANQQTMLLGAIKRQHSKPNFEAFINEAFVRGIASRPVNTTQPVDEIILDRQIYGMATTIGQVDVDFVADDDQAHISLHLHGNNNANSYTTQGPITAYTSSCAQVEARRSILINVGGIHEYQAYVAANLASSFQGTNSFRLIDRIANRQYEKDKYASEAIGARRAEQKLYRQFSDQTSEAIQDGKNQFAEMVKKSSEQSGNIPPSFATTTNDELRLISYKSDTFQFGSNTPPNQYETKCDIKVRIHESMLANYLEPVFSAKQFSNADFAAKAEEVFGEAPKGYDPDSDDTWSITFPRSRPIEVVLDNNQIGISAVGRRFSRDKQRPINEPMSINVAFNFERHQNQLRLVRAGEVEVKFVREGTPTVQMSTFQSFLQDLLNKNFEESEKQGDPILIPSNLIPVDELDFIKDKNAVNDYKLVLLTAEKGWLTAGWRYAPFKGGVRVLGSVQTPLIRDAKTEPATE